jgi:hypothetical protein
MSGKPLLSLGQQRLAQQVQIGQDEERLALHVVLRESFVADLFVAEEVLDDVEVMFNPRADLRLAWLIFAGEVFEGPFGHRLDLAALGGNVPGRCPLLEVCALLDTAM